MISYYGQSDIGRVRKQNEDSILTADSLFLVCDGMGGRKAGEIASRLAVQTIGTMVAESLRMQNAGSASDGAGDHDSLKAAIRVANSAIRKMAAESEDHVGMGTTVAALLFDRSQARVAYANVGDSRIYLMRAGTIAQLSRDDSWLNAAFAGESVDTTTLASMQHVLTKALGTHDHLDFDVKDQELLDGDVLLLCSDGLTNMLTDGEIMGMVAKQGSDLQKAGRELIDAANKAGGRDNISAVLVRYRR